MRFCLYSALVILGFLAGCASSTNTKTKPLSERPVTELAEKECSGLLKFFKFLDDNRPVPIGDVAIEAKRIFGDSAVENRRDLFVVVSFAESLPCYASVTAIWNSPTEKRGPSSPPPLRPGDSLLKYETIEEDPFYWWSETYREHDRAILIKTDRQRIKSIRIEPLPST